MPLITNPPGVGIVNEWANYKDALDGKPVFVARFRVWVNSAVKEYGVTSTEATKQALVEGTEYLWIERAVSASFLWRTIDGDRRSIGGFSGSVLCLGRPTDTSVKAVVFQNYETPIRLLSQIRGGERPLNNDEPWLMKAGFLLPQEIRDSQILMSPSAQERRQNQTFPTDQEPSEASRREFYSDQY